MIEELAQARQTFIAESSELLVEMESALLKLEGSPEDPDLINSLFRSAHTIKGSSGIVGIETVEKFTHVVENLLSKVRENHIRITGGIIELLLECRDHIASLIELSESGSGGGEDTSAREAALLKALGAHLSVAPAQNGAPPKEEKRDDAVNAAGRGGRLAKTDAWHISLRFSPEILRSGMDPISFINYLQKMGEVVSITTLYESLPGCSEMDPERCYLGFELDFRSDFEKKDIEGVFEFVREDSRIHILPPQSRIESYIELIKGAPEDTTLLGEILVKGGALTKEELEEALRLQSDTVLEEDREKKPLIGEILVSEGMVQSELVDAALEKQKKSQSAKTREASTIRIDASKLDSLVNLVGELVISSANMEQHAQRLKDPWLIESASIMTRLVEEIRDDTMRIRMVPIGETFSRFNRVVRDIGREWGKEIELEISGGETELDKTVVEKINDPLMHLVRNAADHGLEASEERIKAGKPAKGTIRLNAFHDAGSIVIEVIDDGRGLDRKKIYEKAVSRGLIPNGANLTDGELFRLVFEPGFSTAEQVTKLSGRGVGMDVVKRNIEGLRGMVEVESGEGEGTTVRIRLPLTLAIIDGFLVGVAESFYVIPLDMVVECVELTEAERETASRRNYVNLRGEILPYISVRDYFAEGGRPGRFEHIVVVQYAGQKIGVVVDELYGEVQTVIKSLGRAYRDVKGISGATIMGNGRVALILDVPGLLRAFELQNAANA